MTYQRVLAQATVTGLEQAVNWYSTLFDRAPDAEPMPGLLEWHFGPFCGVQVWSEPERAGRSTIVLDETDLDGLAARLANSGIEHGGIEPISVSRALQLSDPDGNRIVVTGA